ncbi:hypothetical protein A671_04954 [Salmonella enterica subsp. enterica serovar Dublin str. DG22]|uniref:Uncharacterized protein n=1 Tax=Salmonella enterica subsp. enterica serovar Dublin str. UC16 TaxID=1192688 RepID=M7RWI6_SALDU|nr:hypothetical protein A670_04708 [Salmonella enterica subsp. enterica serovar Dublin str. UC16]EPI64012.1 hypothetical protein A671_04954 [Salmonella enterica subsp. enterica serovar Dublin str. DG22]
MTATLSALFFSALIDGIVRALGQKQWVNILSSIHCIVSANNEIHYRLNIRNSGTFD